MSDTHLTAPTRFVDLPGFLIGGFQVHEVTLRYPQLVRKLPVRPLFLPARRA